MVENVGRKVVLILSLTIVSIVLLLYRPLTTGRAPFPMGLDIAGGERLVYRIPIQEAKERGEIPENVTDAEIMAETITIVKQRVDPRGNREAVVRKIGGERIEISLPKLSEAATRNVRGQLAAEVSAEAAAAGLKLTLAGDEQLMALFPGTGGEVQVGEERFKYSQRIGNDLYVAERGYAKTSPAAHPAGSSLKLVDTDDMKAAIENLGDMRFYQVAVEDNFRSAGSSSTAARDALKKWFETPGNENQPVDKYTSQAHASGALPKDIFWFPHKVEQGQAVPAMKDRFILPLVQPPENWRFTGGDLEKVDRQQDKNGYPAVGFRMREAGGARMRFGDFTDFLAKDERQLAIVINGEVVTAPQVHSGLYADSVIEGRFGLAERDSLVTVLRSGSLKIKPELQESETVGASIGDDYVRKNLMAGLWTMALIVAGMCWYYRWLGVWASISLILNLVLLMAAMVLLQGVLTLAGIGGIVLTMGMAVDANILIYERMREEQEKGRKPIQAAKDGFAGAMSAIVDGNLTTLISALILYNVGTGTVRGFAVTLSIGILTTMFTALVVTGVLVHFQLKRGVERFHMRQLFPPTSFRFMRWRKLAVGGSALFCAVGLVWFIALDDREKLGIEFLGGATVKVRTEEPQRIDDFRARVATLPEPLKSADVVDLPGSRLDDGRATVFRITFKGAGEEQQNDATRFRQEVRTGLADVLQQGPVEAVLTPAGTGATVTGTLYFEERHPTDDVSKQLVAAGFTDAQVSARAGRENVFTYSVATTQTDEGAVRDSIATAFAGKRDNSGSEFKLAAPIPESSIVGSQVVGEMRDKALLALFWACVGMLLYIRVRFAEYSFGWGALLADLHDVLATLTALCFLIAVPWIHVEMNLTMVAAFLTILGYSINDTIVVYDRIRENLPRVKGTLAEICDLSVNQTLSRTALTGSTTIAAALIILAYNWQTGNALEGFAFALTFGVITGTYSSIYIASPLYIWLEERSRRKHAAEGGPAAGAKPQPQPVEDPA